MLHTLKSLGRTCGNTIGRLVRHPQTPTVAGGTAVGIAGWSAAHPFVATFGFHRETLAGLCIGVVAAYSLGRVLGRSHTSLRENGLATLAAAASLILLRSLLTIAESGVAAVPSGALQSPAVLAALLALAAIVVFGIPAFALGTIAERVGRRGETATWLASIGVGLAVHALVLAPAVGLQTPLLAIVAMTAVAWFIRLLRGAAITTPAASDTSSTSTEAARYDTSAACFLVFVGLAGAVCSRVLAQLMFEASYLIAAGAALFLAGCGAGMVAAALWRTRRGNDAGARRLSGLLATFSLLAPLAVFPWLVDRQLDANSYLSSVFWLATVRIATIAVVVVPLGVAAGVIASLVRRPEFSAIGLSCGFVAGGWLLPVAGIVPLAVVACWASIATAIISSGFRRPASRAGWAAACAAGLMTATLVSQCGRFDPSRSAHLLFNTATFMARQGGMPAAILPHVDETRLISQTANRHGIMTVWRKRGETSVVRLDGMPVAAASENAARCPSPSADLMRSALPLLLHNDPESVLVLGDPLGVGTAAAARFPVRQIVCCESAGLPQAAARIDTSDDRVSTRPIEPRLALLDETLAFDVVTCDPGIPSSPAATGYFTQEYYRAAAAALTDDGIFCQRVRFTDFGPAPLAVIAGTMRTAFGEVTSIEVAPGELMLIGVRPGASIVRPGMLDRLKRPHARRLLATLGWDWSVPLNLAVVDDAGLASLSAEADAINSDYNGRLAFTLPQETMRWGAKRQERQAATAGLIGSLLARAVPEADQHDVATRVGEVVGSHRLMTAYPDQPWAYRKDLKSQLAEKPRGVIRPVAGDVLRERHPVDKRRIEYFKALGEAIRSTTDETLARLESYSEPFDPMVTYFLHHEIAPLYAEFGEAGAARELAHRLYTAYYADPNDRSVRDVATTLELLAAHPELLADDAERFDHFNGLIEVLLDRWEARGLNEPRSPEVVMIDIDKSLDATDAALEAMQPLAAAAGMSDDDWNNRQAAIEWAFVRPLRKYRATLLPHLQASMKKTAEAAKQASQE